MSESTGNQVPKRRVRGLLDVFTADRISATTSLATMLLGAYVIFFSPASEALVAYLQSELTSRNNRIATLEQLEAELNLSIRRQKLEADQIASKSADVAKQVAVLERQRLELAGQIEKLEGDKQAAESALAKQSALSRWAAVRGKITEQMVGSIVVTWPLNLYPREERGVEARTEQVWAGYVKFLEKTVKALDTEDQKIGEALLTQFKADCGKFSDIRFGIPDLNYATYDFKLRQAMSDDERNQYDAGIERKHKAMEQAISAIQDKVLRAEEQLEACFKALTPRTESP